MIAVRAAALVAILACLCGCELDPPAAAGTGVDLTRPWIEPMRSTGTSSTPRDVSAKSKGNVLIDEFAKRADQAFDDPETQKHLPRLERLYFDAGRFLELVDLYRRTYDAKGATHYVGPRLAWAYSVMGDLNGAMAVLAKTEKTRPRDPMNPFVRGIIADANPVAEDRAVMVAKSWSRVLELDPKFVGPLGFDATAIKARLTKGGRALPPR